MRERPSATSTKPAPAAPNAGRSASRTKCRRNRASTGAARGRCARCTGRSPSARSRAGDRPWAYKRPAIAPALEPQTSLKCSPRPSVSKRRSAVACAKSFRPPEPSDSTTRAPGSAHTRAHRAEALVHGGRARALRVGHDLPHVAPLAARAVQREAVGRHAAVAAEEARPRPSRSRGPPRGAAPAPRAARPRAASRSPRRRAASEKRTGRSPSLDGPHELVRAPRARASASSSSVR